jgi:hypothetical protein
MSQPKKYTIECSDNLHNISDDIVIHKILQILRQEPSCDERHLMALIMLVRDTFFDYDSENHGSIPKLPEMYVKRVLEKKENPTFPSVNGSETCDKCCNFVLFNYNRNKDAKSKKQKEYEMGWFLTQLERDKKEREKRDLYMSKEKSNFVSAKREVPTEKKSKNKGNFVQKEVVFFSEEDVSH